MKIQHKNCGYIFDMTPRQFLDGAGCAICYGQLITNDVFLERVYDTYQNEYECLEEYNGADNKIRILHKECGRVFEKTPYNFINQQRGCPYCMTGSYGVEVVKKFLIKSHIDFVLEKTYPECKDNGLLRFDFYLIEYDVLVEYDGRQHYSSDSWGGEEALKDRQRKDKIKNAFVKEVGIPLIRIKFDIPYNLIPEYVARELSKYNIYLK